MADEERLRKLEEHYIEISQDIKYMRENFVSLTQSIKELTAKVEGIFPKVENNSKWVDKFIKISPALEETIFWNQRLKLGLWWIATISLGGGFVSILFFVIRNIIR